MRRLSADHAPSPTRNPPVVSCLACDSDAALTGITYRCSQPVRSLTNATDCPSGDTSTFESRFVGENQRSSWSFHNVRVAPFVHALIVRVFPSADASPHTTDPSAVNCTELGFPTAGIHEMSPPSTEATPSRRSVAPPATTPLLLPTTRTRSPLK